ncbi:hypothetical protein GUJ93_ZPchr0012g19243 [Zizania palustris]|uniref:Uncharacterized protein n=1 Tax=Zizania palustris TaxID=103762 RepID=A0A8J5WXJ5_ZIZPA|nr:hypothetical protein GUJ93_ZPchr0012g19243 [Zizania palustris]
MTPVRPPEGVCRSVSPAVRALGGALARTRLPLLPARCRDVQEKILRAKRNSKCTNHNFIRIIYSHIISQWISACPLENLRHVKRVRQCNEYGEKTELSIILCLATGPENFSGMYPQDVKNIVDTYKLNPFLAKLNF